MIDLINYVTLSFDSYNIIKNKEKLISFIDELNYEKYHRLITEKILNNINENIILMQINFFSGYDICSHGEIILLVDI